MATDATSLRTFSPELFSFYSTCVFRALSLRCKLRQIPATKGLHLRPFSDRTWKLIGVAS